MSRGAYHGLYIVSIHAPHEGERLAAAVGRELDVFVSIHAPHEGERPKKALADGEMRYVSIHAPHEGERQNLITLDGTTPLVSIHAPHEGERPSNKALLKAEIEFQSTLPTRGSDCRPHIYGAPHHKFQSTLPTRGSDNQPRPYCSHTRLFQSTLPTRGSDRYNPPRQRTSFDVSIHAPHEGERPFWSSRALCCLRFNPRSPRGGAT